jgi:hypothetical protein
MTISRRCGALLMLLCLAPRTWAQPAAPGAVRPSSSADKVLLIAGDSSLPVFDNAVAGLRARLVAISRGRADITQLSATPSLVAQHVARLATLSHVLSAIAAMRPSAGQGCFVFATSHGVRQAGLYLSARDEVLTPRALDGALARGCGDAPTVVVISSCFSGAFAEGPMRRPNRIVLTAARADRTSFGCQAGRDYTVYDRCLLDAVDRAATWTQAYALIRACVSAEETLENVLPSEPQAWFGAALQRTP